MAGLGHDSSFDVMYYEVANHIIVLNYLANYSYKDEILVHIIRHQKSSEYGTQAASNHTFWFILLLGKKH